MEDILGTQHGFTDKEIRDALWEYYFDVDQTVSWLLGWEVCYQSEEFLALT